MFDYTVTISEAAQYSGIPVRKWFDWMEQGMVPASPGPPGNPQRSEYPALAAVCRIPVSFLPRHAALRFCQERILHESFFSIDFIGFLNRYGEAAFLRLLRTIQLLKRAAALREASPFSTTAVLRQFAAQNHLSLSSLYRKESAFMSSDLKKLVSSTTSTKTAHSRKLCHLSRDYLTRHVCKPNAPSQNQLLRDLTAEAGKLGAAACVRCLYNPDSRSRRLWLKKHPEDVLPACAVSGNGMVVPDTRHPVNRFLRSLSAQDMDLARLGKDAWMAVYAHKTVRDKPDAVNAVFFGDHHLADVLVIVGTDGRDGSPILARPWLTVMTDAASDAIVGSVVTLRPNSMTIAECFCRAVAFTVDSPFYGLPEVFYVDRGKDYRALWLEGGDPALRERLDSDACLNRAFCDNPLLPALNVSVRHALPRSGRSKTIERIFGTITRSWFKPLPGWTGASPENRPFDFEREKKRLLAQGGLMTLEQFARHWFEVIVPAYNTASFDQAQSPMERYQSLPRAHTLTPDWNSLAVFKAVRNRKYKVHPNGIHYRGDFYWHPALQEYISRRGQEDRYVQIYDFDQSFCHSISVLYNGRFICEAEPLVRMRLMETDRLRLAQHLEEQKAARRAVSRRVTRVQQVLRASGVSSSRYAECASDSSEMTLPLYAEEIDSQRDRKEAVILSETAHTLGRIALQQQKAVEQMLHGPEDDPLTDYLLKIGAGKHE